MAKKQKKRKLRKGFKVVFISVPIIAAIILIIIFGFRLQSVNYASDLNQFTQAEVNEYIKAYEIDNTFLFWIRNHLGMSEPIDLFESYSVTMDSPVKVTIKAKEKKLKGYMEVDNMYLYFDETGKVLKYSQDKLDDVLLVTGLKYDKIYLYQPIEATDKKALTSLIKFMKAVGEYDFGVERMDISDDREVTIYIGDLQVQLGKESNLDRKLIALNDMYANVIKHKGVLNMKHLSADGSYTMQEETTKASKKKKEKAKQ